MGGGAGQYVLPGHDPDQSTFAAGTPRWRGWKGLRDELLNIPRMTRSHIYVVNEQGEEVLGRDNALKQLVERRTLMDAEEFQDEPAAFTRY